MPDTDSIIQSVREFYESGDDTVEFERQLSEVLGSLGSDSFALLLLNNRYQHLKGLPEEEEPHRPSYAFARHVETWAGLVEGGKEAHILHPPVTDEEGWEDIVTLKE